MGTLRRASSASGTAVLATALLVSLGGCAPQGADASNTPALAAPAPTGVQYVEGAEVTDAPASGPTVAVLDREELLTSLASTLRRDRSAHEILTIRGPRMTITGEGEVVYGPTQALEMEFVTSSSLTGYGYARWVDGDYYFSFPDLMPQDTWIRISLTSGANPLGQDFGAVGPQVDTLGALAAMRPAVRSVRHLGGDTMYGEPTVRYRVVVDTDRGMRAQGIDRARVGPLPPNLAYDVWLDAQQRPVKIMTEVDGYRVTSELSDWGGRVRIRPPRPRDVVHSLDVPVPTT